MKKKKIMHLEASTTMTTRIQKTMKLKTARNLTMTMKQGLATAEKRGK